MNSEPKKLYRARSNRMIGGVCAGLGRYFNIDPTLIRIIFVVLVFAYFASVLVYLIMWVLVPQEPEASSAITPVDEDRPES